MLGSPSQMGHRPGSPAFQGAAEATQHPCVLPPSSPPHHLLQSGVDPALSFADAATVSWYHRTEPQLRQPGLSTLPVSIKWGKHRPSQVALLRGLPRSGFQVWRWELGVPEPGA